MSDLGDEPAQHAARCVAGAGASSVVVQSQAAGAPPESATTTIGRRYARAGPAVDMHVFLLSAARFIISS